MKKTEVVRLVAGLLLLPVIAVAIVLMATGGALGKLWSRVTFTAEKRKQIQTTLLVLKLARMSEG